MLLLRGRSAATQNQSEPAGQTPAARQEQEAAPGAPVASNPAEGPGATPSAQAANHLASPNAPVAPATPFLLGSADTPPAMEPATVLSNMRIAIQQYGSRFGGNPVGTNPEITKALNGDNPK